VPEKKTKVQLAPNGPMLDAVEVGVAESTERWSEIKLDDGSILRIKPVVIGTARVDGQYDQEGNPVYTVKVNQVMTVASSPEHLRKGGNPSKGVQ
jgi:hypothetical protein